MSDHDRGAYTPQADAPLQFDARHPRGRRPLPLALMASGAVLAVLVVALGLHYSHGMRGDNEPPRPVGEPVATLKTPPRASAQPNDPSAGLAVMDDGAAASANSSPTFAPPPEQPQSRVAAAVPAAPAPPRGLQVQSMPLIEIPKARPGDSVPRPAAPVQVARQAAPKPIEKAASPVEKPKPAGQLASNAPAGQTTNTQVGPAAAKPKAKLAPATAPTAWAGGGAMVQIGAFSSAELATKGWSDVSTAMSGQMGGKGKHVEPVESGGHTLYRTAVTGFADRVSATSFCDALKAKGKICFVKG